MDACRLSPFTKISRRGNFVALFNTLTLKKVYLSNKEFESLLSGKITASIQEKLSEKKLIVPTNFDSEEYFEKVKGVLLPKTPSIQLMYLLLTEDCNYDCKYCFIEPRIREEKFNMPEEIAIKAVNIFSKQSERNAKDRKIIFYGGEPLINCEVLKKSALYAKELIDKIQLNLVTNGSLISKELARFLVDNNFNTSISLDGPKKVNDQIRVFYKSNKGTFDATLKGYKTLQNEGKTPSISCTVGPHNVEKLEEITEYFIQKLETRGLGFNILTYTEKVKAPETDIVAENMIRAYDVARAYGVTENRIHTKKAVPFVEEKPWTKDCAGYGHQIVVTPQGKIGTCHAFWPENRYLDLNVDSTENIAANENWVEWNRRTAYNMPQCKECPCISLCGGGCAYYAYTQKQTIWDIDERICKFSNFVLNWMIWDLFEKLQSEKKTIDNGEVIIRAPSWTDQRRWGRFLRKMKTETNLLDVDALIKDEKKWLRGMINLNYSEKGVTYIIQQQNEIVGFANLLKQKEGYEIGVGIVKEFRGKGLGNYLVKKLIKKAKDLNFSPLIIKTVKENEPMKAIALKENFKVVLSNDKHILFKRNL